MPSYTPANAGWDQVTYGAGNYLSYATGGTAGTDWYCQQGQQQYATQYTVQTATTQAVTYYGFQELANIVGGTIYVNGFANQQLNGVYHYQYQYQTGIGMQTNPAYQLTPEEMAAQEAAHAEQQKLAAEAKERSEELLLSMLNEQQREQFSKERTFDLQIGKKVYRLREHYKVHLIEAGKPKLAYCIHPDMSHGLPGPDVLLAQKLWLETDEAAFLAKANVWSVDGSLLNQVASAPVVNMDTANLALELAA